MGTVIDIEFSTEELEAYKAWILNVKPRTLSHREFNKVVFLMGVDEINSSATDQIAKLIDDNPDKFQKAVEEQIDAIKEIEQATEGQDAN